MMRRLDTGKVVEAVEQRNRGRGHQHQSVRYENCETATGLWVRGNEKGPLRKAWKAIYV